VGFSALVHQLVQKEKVLLSLGELKYTSNTFVKEYKKPYNKKEEKSIHMANNPKSPSRKQVASSSQDISHIFPITRCMLLKDLMKRGLLQPFKPSDDTTPLG